MAVRLTAGAIPQISGEDWQNFDLKPVLQVTDIRMVVTQSSAAQQKERYKLLLSDGVSSQQGMLATNHNELVTSNLLQIGSVLRLDNFVRNLIRDRIIILLVSFEILDKCDIIGDPTPVPTPPMASHVVPSQSSLNQSATTARGARSSIEGSLAGSVIRPDSNVSPQIYTSERQHTTGLHSYGTSFNNNYGSGQYITNRALFQQSPANNRTQPMQQTYNQQSSMYGNRAPIAKNEAPSRIIPIAALNPYQGNWTVKARVSVKGELRHYKNAKGDGKVFSFDLLDSDGGEIRATCFNAVADQFYNQIEVGKVYYISKGSIKPAQKAFNHLKNDHEITLDYSSTVQPCFDDDTSIPRQQFHFCSIGEIENMDTNNILDIIGVVSSIKPSQALMTKNNVETQKQVLTLRDGSGRSIDLTLWGNFCNVEGQTLQQLCDSGQFPVLAVKSAKVHDFNGKSIGTISLSQLSIEPDIREARNLRAWFDSVGRNTPSISMSTTHLDVCKTLSQIKDEKLGTFEKPDWITVKATISQLKLDYFCYTACPNMVNGRQCTKKVVDNGDGKWRCDKCDQVVDECDYRYILQLQIQDHTGSTWTTAFQETGEKIMGVSAKELYFIKHEKQDDDMFTEIVRNVLLSEFTFKLKVKEEVYGDDQRAIKSNVHYAEKINFSSKAKSLLLDLQNMHKKEDPGSIPPYLGLNPPSGNMVHKNTAPMNYAGGDTAVGQRNVINASHLGHYGSQYGGNSGASGECYKCRQPGHIARDCPGVGNAVPPYGSGAVPSGRFDSGFTSGGGSSGTSGGCFKCHQPGHYARDCPGASNVASPYGRENVASARFDSGISSGGGNSGASGNCFKCNQSGHYANNCPAVNGSVASGRFGNGMAAGGGNSVASIECYRCHQFGHYANNCPGV
uniref:replication protein A 70 kDa DNA-binding subunit A-like n=1 Tax=Erigeron canadensis TaxID=72917 RepID=UPI001CB90A2C|nr:replication protein A 70 kDa DNA-binding subunit A-like [Erigeron canadensis]